MTDPKKNEVEKKFKQALTPEMERTAPFFKELIESFNYITLFKLRKRMLESLIPLLSLKGKRRKMRQSAFLNTYQSYNRTNGM